MATCPTCRQKPADAVYKPFCCKRCADVDLQRWFTGGYVLPDSLHGPPIDDREED